jgi:hypothetical protein
MAYDLDPASWFPGFTEDGVSFTIPLSAVPGLGSSDIAVGSGAGGDMRKVWYRLSEAMFAAYEAGNVPDQMLLSKQTSVTRNSESGSRIHVAQFGISVDTEVLPEA